MKDNYIKKEIIKNRIYEYVFENNISIDELLDFCKRLEDTQYYDSIEYIVSAVADEYESSNWAFFDADAMMNDRDFFNKKSLIGINILGYKNGISSNIGTDFNSNTIAVRSKGDSELFNVIESCFTRQMIK